MSKLKVTVVLSHELFAFESFDDWLANGAEQYQRHSATIHNTVCIDSKGHILSIGKHFREAQERSSYPARCYAL
jgi:hypothetical protein